MQLPQLWLLSRFAFVAFQAPLVALQIVTAHRGAEALDQSSSKHICMLKSATQVSQHVPQGSSSFTGPHFRHTDLLDGD